VSAETRSAEMSGGIYFSKGRPAKSGGAGNIIPYPEQKVKKKIMGKIHKVWPPDLYTFTH
jgi:hypothetical protein